MCVAVPTKIESIEGTRATVALAGARAQVALDLVPEAKVGDYVLVHAGFALTVVDEAEAKETFALLREMGAGGTE
jgi:hydrogenase expression/formation protein HypC